MTFRFRS